MSSYEPPAEDEAECSRDPGNLSSDVMEQRSKNRYINDNLKQGIKYGAAVGFGALVLGGIGYGALQVAEESSIDYSPLMLEYSEELNEAASCSFEAINHILG